MNKGTTMALRTIAHHEEHGVTTRPDCLLAHNVLRLYSALEKIQVGHNAHHPDTYHDNAHHSSCALQDCGCLDNFIKGVLRE